MPVLTIAWLGVPMTEQREPCAACDYTDNGWCTCSCHQLAYTPSGLDEFHGPTSLWVDPSPLPVLSLFEEEK